LKATSTADLCRAVFDRAVRDLGEILVNNAAHQATFADIDGRHSVGKGQALVREQSGHGAKRRPIS
jgi:hypothetical protein